MQRRRHRIRQNGVRLGTRHAIADRRDEGFTELILGEEMHHVIRGGVVGLNATELIGEVCLAIEIAGDDGQRQGCSFAPDGRRHSRQTM